MAKKKESPEDIVFENLKKMHGKEFICKGSDVEPRAVLPSGFSELDKATGVGGIPLGIIMELFGPEASGKGVLSMHICASAQENGEKAVWVDAENQFNRPWMELNGVDTDKLTLVQPLRESAETILEAVKDLADTGAFSVIVIDSLASLVPQIEIDKPMGETQVGRMGAIMSTALRKITPVAASNNCTIIFINQIRDKIGVMFGNPETTPGGKSLKHYSSLRIRIQRLSDKIEIEREGEKEQIGGYSKAKVHKNRFGMPFKEAIIPIYYEEYNPSPLDLFVAFARKCLAITVRKGTYYFGKMAGESPMEVMHVVYANEAIPEFVEKVDEQMKKKKIDLEDFEPEVAQVLETMRKGEFKIEDLNQ